MNVTWTSLVLDLDLVDQAELDEVEAQLGVDHVRERVVDVVLGRHESNGSQRVAWDRCRSWCCSLIFIVVPLAELYVIFKVGEAIGFPLTILILAVDSIVGSLLLKSQGRAVWRRFNETMAAGPDPAPRGARRRDGDLRRRVPDHARVPHRHPRAPAPAAAHARTCIRRSAGPRARAGGSRSAWPAPRARRRARRLRRRGHRHRGRTTSSSRGRRGCRGERRAPAELAGRALVLRRRRAGCTGRSGPG